MRRTDDTQLPLNASPSTRQVSDDVSDASDASDALEPVDAGPGASTELAPGQVTDGSSGIDDSHGVVDWKALGWGLFATGLGGALVGWLATGGRGWRGAAIGAGVHTALLLSGTALLGRKRLPGRYLVGFGAAAAATAGGTYWLFTQQRRGGVR